MLDFIKANLGLFLILFLIVVAPNFVAGAFQVLAYIILAILLLIIIGVLVMRWKLSKFVKEHQNDPRFQSQRQSQGQWQRQGGSRSERVEIFETNSSRATKKRVANDIGDYVDFEEVESDK